MKRLFCLSVIAFAACGPMAQDEAPSDSEVSTVASELTVATFPDGWGGKYFKEFGWDSVALQHEPYILTQRFVVGTDYSVWTNWNLADGSKNGWVSLGGQVRRTADWKIFAGFSNGNALVKVKGTDNRWYFRIRVNGSWRGWALCNGTAC